MPVTESVRACRSSSSARRLRSEMSHERDHDLHDLAIDAELGDCIAEHPQRLFRACPADPDHVLVQGAAASQHEVHRIFGGWHLGAVFMHESPAFLDGGPAQHLVQGEPQRRTGCRVGVADGRVMAVDHHRDLQLVQQRLQAPLVVAERGFLDLSGRDVLDLRDEMKGLTALIAHDGTIELREDDIAASINVALLQAVALPAPVQKVLDELEIAIQVVRVGDVLEGKREKLGFAVVEYPAKGIVDREEAALEADDGQPDRRIGQCEAELLLALVQLVAAFLRQRQRGAEAIVGHPLRLDRFLSLPEKGLHQRNQGPYRDRGGHRCRCGEVEHQRVESIDRIPDADHVHEVGDSAGEDERREHAEDPVEVQMLLAAQEVDQREGDREIAQTDEEVRQHERPQQPRVPTQAVSMRHERRVVEPVTK